VVVVDTGKMRVRTKPVSTIIVAKNKDELANCLAREGILLNLPGEVLIEVYITYDWPGIPRKMAKIQGYDYPRGDAGYRQELTI